MNSTAHAPAHSPRRATRSSLACLACRSRHLKCDGTRPRCDRCAEMTRECQYTQSRRGGLDRAALAERRRRLAVEEMAGEAEAGGARTGGRERRRGEGSITDGMETDTGMGMGTGFLDNYGLLDEISFGDQLSGIMSSPAAAPQAGLECGDISKDPLMAPYYSNFHKFHPFILPRQHLSRLYLEPNRQPLLAPLLAAMRLVGDIYNSKQWSQPLETHLDQCISQATPANPFTVQAHLLYASALFWHEREADAKMQLSTAVQLALSLDMHQREFATRHGGDDPVLEESWRRTWWMLYIVDAYFAGTMGTMNFEVVDVDATVDLPCEEGEYESGDIPAPMTLADFDSREFAADDIVFSSFAYLIGAVRCAALAISAVPKVASSEAEEEEDSHQVMQAADSVLNSWSLFLPREKKQVMSKTGEVDELMFQAHMIIHVATIGLHRPYSDLRFNPIEDISSCARQPPLSTPTPDLINVHTFRVLRSAESQIRLLALPTTKTTTTTARCFHHTPFTTCMLSEGTLALLSACAFLLRGRDLAVAREQVRMTIGCLRVLGEVWPRTARNVREIQVIAHHVLGLGGAGKTGRASARSSSGSANGSGTVGSSRGALSNVSSGGGTQASSVGSTGEDGGDLGLLSSLDGIGDLCGWYNVGDLQQ